MLVNLMNSSADQSRSGCGSNTISGGQDAQKRIAEWLQDAGSAPVIAYAPAFSAKAQRRVMHETPSLRTEFRSAGLQSSEHPVSHTWSSMPTEL